ncbi:MAG: chromosomal replication initiator protein DnaA [Acidobacteriota bacterium]|nr:chromosomal replication initiator protein DnaA [Acidobacteriota bacterium]MDE2921960.1 chromosomal replication initiator protein DnaA [Acidobacteriota bacterium]MDE3265724.1 chromosomal replication initiator protein DnaA [Acidobacteriota bacterium]
MPSSVWPTLRRQLRADLPAEDFRTWFHPLRVASEDADHLVLEAPNSRFVEALEEGFRPIVDWAIADLKGPTYQVLFKSGETRTSVATPKKSSRTKSVGSPDLEGAPSSSLNPQYRFDSFVVGNSNRFASAASQAVAEKPGIAYNPLFLYGGVGLGKTHLLHAIGNRLRRAAPGTRVVYLAAEDFVNDLITSIRFERMPAFRERYRTIDVLLVDDIQFLAKKERSQEEFFHTFNVLYTRQKQIIVTSDAQPRDMADIEERLRSRFGSGLLADIQPPDLETKVAILQRKARQLQGLDLDTDVAMFIARQVHSNVRELEGLLNRVTAFASLSGVPLDLEFAKEALRDVLPEQDRPVSSAQIIKMVAHHYGLKVREIKSKSNSRQITYPRQIAMYLCKRLTEMSYPEIGRVFNGKHHSTVMYSVEQIERRRAGDERLAAQLERFTRQLS